MEKDLISFIIFAIANFISFGISIFITDSNLKKLYFAIMFFIFAVAILLLSAINNIGG